MGAREPASSLILVRAKTLSEPTAAFGAELAAVSGCEVCFLLDGRFPVEVSTALPKVDLTQAACAALGLYCPPNFQWQCGDYGIYLARRQFPAKTHIWLIEHDIRIAGGDICDFFETFKRRPEIDLLACEYGPAPWWWAWYSTADGRDVIPHRCLFGVVRLSAPAVDALLEKRRLQSRRSNRRRLWPNDEGFVATTLANGGFACRDINDFGASFYDDSTLSLTQRIRGETFEAEAGRLRIYHPVLFGDDYSKGNSTRFTEDLSAPQRAVRKARRWINRNTRW